MKNSHVSTGQKREPWGNPERGPVSFNEARNSPPEVTDLERIVHPRTGAYMTGLAFQQEVQEAKRTHGSWPAPDAESLPSSGVVGKVVTSNATITQGNSHIPAEQFNPDRYAYACED